MYLATQPGCHVLFSDFRRHDSDCAAPVQTSQLSCQLARKLCRNRHERQLVLTASTASESLSSVDAEIIVPEQTALRKAGQPRQGQLQLPGGQTFATFVGLWDTLTARLLPLHSTGASADMLLAAIRLVLASAGSTTMMPRMSSGSIAPHDSSYSVDISQDQREDEAPMALNQLLGVALHLADLSSAGMPLDTSAIAAGLLAEPLCSGRLSLAQVRASVPPEVAHLLEHIAAVHSLPAAVDVYDDSTCRSVLLRICLSQHFRAACMLFHASSLDHKKLGKYNNPDRICPD